MSFNPHAEPFSSISLNIATAKSTVTRARARQKENAAMDGAFADIGRRVSGDAYGLEEEDTQDEFGKKMIREMRQQAAKWRAENARPQAFRKARARPGTGLTMENLGQMAKRDDEVREAHQRTGSSCSGSSTSDPPLNVPRQWGRKARRNTDWLKRIAMNPDLEEGIPQVRKTGSIDWPEAAANVPLPSVEESPSSRPASKKGTPAPRAAQNSTSLGDASYTELSEELFVGSFLTSTPAVVSKGAKLGEIRQRELKEAMDDAMESGGYPTPPPDKNDTNSVGRAVPSHNELLEDISSSPENPITIASTSKALVRSKQQGSEEPHKSPIAVTKSAHPIGTVDREIQSNIQKSPERPQHQREDSRDLLRRLARSASQTPSPARLTAGSLSSKQTQAEPLQPSAAQSVSSKPQAHLHQSNKQAVQNGALDVTASSHEESSRHRKTFEKQTTDPPDGQGSIPQSIDSYDTGPVSTDTGLMTPKVTGAWVQTPAPSILESRSDSETEKKDKGSMQTQKQSSYRISAENKSAKAEDLKNHRHLFLPPSALSAVISEARIYNTAGPSRVDDLGEATIQSLEEIIEPRLQTSFLDNDDDTADLAPKDGQLTSKQLEQARERRQLRTMNARLRAARNSMRDTRHGLQRVEQKVRDAVGQRQGQTPEANSEAAAPARSSSGTRIVSCECAQQLRTRPDKVAWRLAKGIWYYHDENDRFRLTYFSLGLLVFWTWFALEFTSCLIWCRPLYGYGDYPNFIRDYADAPEFPFVIPTILLRPFAFIWRPLLSTALTVLHHTLGGFEEWLSEAEYDQWLVGGLKATHRVLTSATSTLQNVWSTAEAAGDWTMNDDEYL